MATKPKSEHPEAADGRTPADVEAQAGGAGGDAEESGIAIEVEPPDSDEPSAEESAAAEPAEQSPEERLAALEQKNLEIEQKNKDTYERLLRATADLDNFRKRARRDLEDARVEARSRVLREMLPVIDNLERAVAHAEGTADSKGIVEGVSLVLRQFVQALERCSVKPIEAQGQAFDPNVHEAVGQQESAEHPPGTVAQVLQKGYWIGDRLLRPALVVVSKGAPEAGAGEAPASEVQANGEDRAPGAANGEDTGGQA